MATRYYFLIDQSSNYIVTENGDRIIIQITTTDNDPADNALFLKYRDKRLSPEFRDKRLIPDFRDKRDAMGFRDKREIVKHRDKRGAV